jgi:hypothetical protein
VTDIAITLEHIYWLYVCIEMAAIHHATAFVVLVHAMMLTPAFLLALNAVRSPKG